MKLQYASDLHLEFPENEDFLRWDPLYPEAEVLLLAGDIVPFGKVDKFSWFFDRVSEDFEQVYWLPGNHEYYHFDLAERCGTFNIPIRQNVSLINDFAVTHGNARLIFSTLWTDISPRLAYAVERGHE